MLQAITKVAGKPLAQLIISSLFFLPLHSIAQIDTVQIGKEITEILKKHGIKNPVFELSIKSTGQKGGQTALIINNYNGNITMVSDVSYAEYAKLDITGLAIHAGWGLIQGETDLSLLMKKVVSYKEDYTKMIISDTALQYADLVIKQFPHFPYVYACKAVVLRDLKHNFKESINSAKKAIEIFEITTKIEGHLSEQDTMLSKLRIFVKELEDKGY